MSDTLIQAERTKLAELRATYQDKLATLKPAFPEMIALKNQIGETESDINTQMYAYQKLDQRRNTKRRSPTKRHLTINSVSSRPMRLTCEAAV